MLQDVAILWFEEYGKGTNNNLVIKTICVYDLLAVCVTCVGCMTIIHVATTLTSWLLLQCYLHLLLLLLSNKTGPQTSVNQ